MAQGMRGYTLVYLCFSSSSFYDFPNTRATVLPATVPFKQIEFGLVNTRIDSQVLEQGRADYGESIFFESLLQRRFIPSQTSPFFVQNV